MRHPRAARASLAMLAAFVAGTGVARAQPGTDTTATAKGEATVLVPPQGGTADVPVRFSSNVLLTFPSPLAPRVVQSSPDWVVRDFADSVVARALTAAAQPTTIALATADGAIKVNITLRLVPESADALALVRFQTATAEEAFRAAVDAEVARRTTAATAALDRARRAIEARVRARAERLTAARLLARLDVQRVKAHARNADDVIVHGQRIVRLGDAAFLVFELENRSSTPYRLATIAVRDPRGVDRAGAAAATGPDPGEPGVLATVPAGASGRAAVAIRQPAALIGAALTLRIAEPGGARPVTVDRGLAIQ